ncbi:MAG: DUF1611 domain-containing protein [Chloroflexota bacterium]|nr:DUF1611 domain-containing protein [Chloroflexota bacterium]
MRNSPTWCGVCAAAGSYPRRTQTAHRRLTIYEREMKGKSGLTAMTTLTDDMKARMRISYALRRIPEADFASLAPLGSVERGDIALARVEKIGKNGGLELPTGRRSTLHEGDVLAVVFGNRYATRQFEGYARTDGDRCHMLSMGGLAGMVESKHASVADPTRLQLIGALADASGSPLRLQNYALAPDPAQKWPKVVVVCGTSMDAGKTYTTMSIILGLQRQGHRVAGVKLTGTAAGRDVWSMVDAGACVGLDFVDGGFPSTYLCTLDELLALYNTLVTHAASQGAEWVALEIADGLLQRETAALLQSQAFTSTVSAWILAGGEPMAALSGASILRGWGIEPLAVSGVVTMSALGVEETKSATGLSCLTARELQSGALNAQIMLTTPGSALYPVNANVAGVGE